MSDPSSIYMYVCVCVVCVCDRDKCILYLNMLLSLHVCHKIYVSSAAHTKVVSCLLAHASYYISMCVQQAAGSCDLH